MSSRQTDRFLADEADAWFRRNRAALGVESERDDDPVVATLADEGLRPARLLEIGCSTGWRLGAWRRRFPETVCSGLDPSAEAVAEGRRLDPALDLRVGTAEALPFEDERFDAIVFGFSLYLCDRSDLFRIAAEADRVLVEGGHLVIYDFFPTDPHRRRYSHREGVWSYKMDHAALFAAHPAYSRVRRETWPHPGCDPDQPDDRVGVEILQRLPIERAFPSRDTSGGESKCRT